MVSRKLGIGLLLMLAVVVTTGTFAYWASSVASDSATTTGNTVTIGTGSAVTTTVSVSNATSTAALVPTGHGSAGDDTTTLTIPVIWDADQSGAAGILGTLAVSVDTFTVGTLDNTATDLMFNVTVTSGTGDITEGSSQNVVITILFQNEPTTSAIYDAVQAGTLTITLTFTVNAQ